MSDMGIYRQLTAHLIFRVADQTSRIAVTLERRTVMDGDCYFPFTMEQWVAAVFHVPESLIQVSLHITVRAR